MPQKKPDRIAALSEELLGLLESQRKLGNEAYPPTLKRLGELCGEPPSEVDLVKAAAKKVFTAKAAVTKVDRAPSLVLPVYFKDDAPSTKKRPSKPAAPRKPKDDGAELAGRMLLVLEAQKRLGDDSYPPTLRRLAELCDVNASDTRVIKAVVHKTVTEIALVAAKVNKKPSLNAPVILRADLEGGLTTALPALLRFALAAVSGAGKGKSTETTAFTPSEVKGKLVLELQKPLLVALDHGIERRDLPDNVAWVITKGKPYLFLVENMRPGAARPSHPVIDGGLVPGHVADRTPVSPVRPTHGFAGAFRAAFEQLDRQNRATNFVKLADLRRALAEFGRDEFDSGLRVLRLDGEFSLDSHEGLHGSLTPEEREAGVREAGSLLIYVSRR
jgi:hypothetical protein